MSASNSQFNTGNFKPTSEKPAVNIDMLDRRLIILTQSGLPLTSRPYHTLATELGIAAAEVMQRLQKMQDSGIIRRITAVPNHYALGIKRMR